MARGRAHKWVETGEIDYEQDGEQQRFDRAVHDGRGKDVERLLAARPKKWTFLV